jgi:catechol 2,3-dioxygenase-like lactoylglutathione lyase family enzyme
LLDHVFITVKDLDRSIAFYETALKPLGIVHAIDYDGKDGPEGHPDLKGFGRDGRVFFWLRQGDADAKAAHIGFVAKSKAEVNAFYEAAMAAGATTASPARACITIPVITLRTFSIPTVTVSRRSTRTGNTANDRASKFQRATSCENRKQKVKTSCRELKARSSS